MSQGIWKKGWLHVGWENSGVEVSVPRIEFFSGYVCESPGVAARDRYRQQESTQQRGYQ